MTVTLNLPDQAYNGEKNDKTENAYGKDHEQSCRSEEWGLKV